MGRPCRVNRAPKPTVAPGGGGMTADLSHGLAAPIVVTVQLIRRIPDQTAAIASPAAAASVAAANMPAALRNAAGMSPASTRRAVSNVKVENVV